MKTLRWFGIVLAMLALALPVLAQDNTDEANQERNATEAKLTLVNLLDGAEITDTLDSLQGRLYTFYGAEGDSVTISMTQINDALDPYLVLLGPAGQVIALDDDSGETMFSSLIADATLPLDGDYFIMATSYSYLTSSFPLSNDTEDLTYEYTLTLDGNSANPEEAEAFRYFAGELVMGESQAGYSTLEEPVFYYTFEAQAGDVVTVKITEADFDTLLYLFGPTGERIGVNDDYEGLNAGIANIELPEDGLYLVFATALNYRSVPDFVDDEGEFFGGEFTIELVPGITEETEETEEAAG